MTLGGPEVTGQVEFDSHMSATLLAAVALVNAVVPGLRGGRPVDAPAGEELVRAVAGALAGYRDRDLPGGVEEAAALAAWAPRLRAVLEDVEAGRVDDACAALNAVLRDAGAVPTLSRHDGEPWHLHFHRPDAGFAAGWAAGMATALATVVGSSSLDRLGVCRADACDRVYADTSRNGTRRFCSTACQNRVKAAAFRARRAAG